MAQDLGQGDQILSRRLQESVSHRVPKQVGMDREPTQGTTGNGDSWRPVTEVPPHPFEPLVIPADQRFVTDLMLLPRMAL